MTDRPKIAVRGIDHINIETRDLAASIAFYDELFGLKPGWRPAFDVPGAWLYAAGKPVVHLVERPDAPHANERPVNHFAFQANGLQQLEQKLQSRGLHYDKTFVPGTEIVQIFVRDPSNVGVECSFADALS